MSSPPDAIDSYINKTVSAERQAADQAAEEEISEQTRYERALRIKLQKALDKDDRKNAIRIAYQLLDDDGEDGDIDTLYDFLLTRVGVNRREAWFAISEQPAVQWVSGICVAVPLLFLVAHILSPEQASPGHHTDVLSCLAAALIFGIPLWDILFARVYNYINRYRLVD